MEKVIEFILKNKEWIFSGIGVALISAIISIFLRKKRDNKFALNINLKNEVSVMSEKIDYETIKKIFLEIKQNENSASSESSDKTDGKNVLSRKRFNVLEMAEFIDILGLNTLIRKIDTKEYYDYFIRDLWHYSKLKSPKLLIFKAIKDQNEKEPLIGCARILDMDYKYEQSFSKSLYRSKIGWKEINSMTIMHNHISYKLESIDSTFMATSNYIGELTAKDIKPLFILITTPTEIIANSFDIQMEVYPIDLILRYILKKEYEIIWEIKLENKHNLDIKLPKKIIPLINQDYIWLLRGTIESEPHINIIYWNDLSGKLNAFPIYNKEIDKIFYKSIKENREGFKQMEIKTSFIEYYLNK